MCRPSVQPVCLAQAGRANTFLSGVSRRPRDSGSLPDRSKHTPQTFDQVHDLALAMNVEVDFVISESRVIDGFLQAEQRLDHLSWQNVTYPYADEQGDRRNDSERPLRFADELSGVGVILLDPGPVRRFKRSGPFENVLA